MIGQWVDLEHSPRAHAIVRWPARGLLSAAALAAALAGSRVFLPIAAAAPGRPDSEKNPSACSDLLSAAIGDSPEEVLHALEKLPPYLLNYHDLQASIEELMTSLGGLRAPYQNLKKLEKAYSRGKLSPSAINHLASAFARGIAEETAEMLKMGSADRKTLEGERILLSRLRQLQQRTLRDLAKEEHAESRPISTEDLAKQMEREMSRQLQRPAQPTDVENASERNFENVMRQAAEKLMSEPDENGKEPDPAPSPEPSATEKTILDRLEKEKGERENGEEGDNKQDAQEGQEGRKGPQSGSGEEPGNRGKNQGEGKSDGPSDSKGQRQGGEGQKTADAADGRESANGDGTESRGSKGERRQGLDGHAETKRFDGKQEDGADGQHEGGAHGAKDFLKSLGDLLNKFKSDGKGEGKTEEKVSKEELERLARRKKFDSKLKKPAQKAAATEAAARKILRQEEKTQILEALMAETWKQTLTQYQNSGKLLRQIADFSAMCQSLSVREHGAAHILRPYAEKANELGESLQRLEVQYRDLEELGLSLSGGEAKSEALRKIRFLERLFTEKERLGTLSEPENKALLLARAILGAADAEASGPANNQEVIEAFRSQLLGPLSRRAFEDAFPPARARDDVDYDRAFNALKERRLDDLVLYSRLAPYVNILLNDVYKPKYFDRHEGEFVPVSEADVVLERADDFEDVPRIVREGNPSKLEILRLIAGDLLKNAYREKVRKSDPRKPVPKRASIILYDISGSMSSSRKQDIRNAIVNAFVDRSQTEVAKGEGEHTVYLVPFDGKPHEPRRVGSVAEAQEFFDQMRARPLGSGGDDSITEGMVKAYEMIAQHQTEGGELERANILLITDAVARIHFDQIKKARAKVDPNVDLALNAITVGDWNQDVSEMIKRYAVNGEGEIGKVSHQHIPYEEINRLLDVAKSVEGIVSSAKEFSVRRNAALPARALDDIRGAVLTTAHQADSEDRMAAIRLERWLGHMEDAARADGADARSVSLSGEATASRSPAAEGDAQKLVDHFLEVVMGSVGKEWSVSAKINAWETFLSLAEEKAGMPSETLITRAGAERRALVVKWLRK